MAAALARTGCYPRSMARPLPLLLLLPLAACCGEDSGLDDSGDGRDPTLPSCPFSFVVLTDTHVGEGQQDHGDEGWDDAGGEGSSAAEATLGAAVDATNALLEGDDPPAFAVILGDLTDSGERSELERARDQLARLELPWLPLLGNHDVWPYTATTEAQAPSGDALMLEVFADAFLQAEAELPGLARAPSVWNPEIEAESHLVNLAFEHCGVRFVALDTNTRVHAPDGDPGVGPEAALHDFEGGSWPWLMDDLTQGPGAGAGPVVVLAHHPFSVSSWTSLDQESFARVEEDLAAHGLEQRVRAFLGGHLHFEIEQEGPLGIPVVLSDATKDGAGPRVLRMGEDGALIR